MTNANILSLKKSLALWLWILLFTIPAGAQKVGINTTTPLAALHVDLGDVLFRNNTTVLADPGIVAVPVTGPGTRMMWIAEKSAFRLGTVHNNDWNADSIGTWSTGIGYSTKAKGLFSLALGLQTTASGITSTALGYNTRASGENSISMGSVTIASGQVSTAMGSGTLASGITSTALGYSTIASGENSIAVGSVTTASGANTTAIGFKTYAASYGSFSLGRYNDTIVNANRTSWVGTDPLLIVGNGTSDVALHNAMVVYKNGSMVLKNPSTVIVNPGFLSPPISGPGTRMMWLPEKSALRIGTVHNNDWNADSIGTWSTGIGYSTKAKGLFSLALGLQTTASGATSTALGYSTKASGENSISMGSVTTASGANTTTMGFKTYASSYGSVSIGRYNDKIASSNSTAWVEGDPLLMVGNGTSDAALHNAMVVYKNGNLVLKNPTPVYDAPATYDISVSGPGTRMVWLPGYSAFSVGTYDEDYEALGIGLWSFTSGYNTRANGNASTAFGSGSEALNNWTTAMGLLSKSEGLASVAMGAFARAVGDGSIAMGNSALAFGETSIAMGNGSIANGFRSTAFGDYTIASGAFSTSGGHYNLSKGFSSTVFGMFNDSILTTNQTIIDPITPLFIIGNGDGTGVGQRRNAMVVRKDGHVGIGTNTPATFLHVDVGSNYSDGIIVSGVYNGSSTVPNLGAGSRMIYFPGKAAFRAGSVVADQWDNSNTGTRSFAVGYNTKASAQESAAFGSYSMATGPQGFASGFSTTASGTASTAMGSETMASGDRSTSMGGNTKATGEYSTAIGNNSIAIGANSIAAGFESKARGGNATAIGYRAAANSIYSGAFGFNTIAKGYATTVVGMYNDSMFLVNQVAPTATKAPLFVVGNGGVAQRNNALVIYKDGDAEIDGYTRLGDSTATSFVPRIKMKKLTGTSANIQNGFVFIPHGVTGSKILSVDIIMIIPGFVNLPPSYTWTPGYEYNFQVGDSSIVVINSAANSSNLISRAFTILIVYEE